MRERASSIAWRILASVCFSLSWMWTSLLPLAWSAMSPWRVLFSIDACKGLIPPVPRISVRFLRSASLKICSSMSGRSSYLELLMITLQLLRAQRGERLVPKHVEAGDDANHGHEQRRQHDAGSVLAGE